MSDGRGRLYLVGVAEQPEPNLAARGQTTVTMPLTALAATDSALVGVNTQGRLESFALPDLNNRVPRGSKGRQIFSRKERVERVVTPPVVVPELPAADGKSESKD